MSEPPVEKSQSRFTAWIWVFVCTYAIGVAVIAWVDLTASYTVDGLHRKFESPYETVHGIVVDPRPGTLNAELKSRYDIRLEPRVFTERGLGDGQQPRLVKVGDTVWLVVGRFGARHVVFDPAVGVVLLREGVLSDVPATVLHGLREAPW